jgi:hypothetical protein
MLRTGENHHGGGLSAGTVSVGLREFVAIFKFCWPATPPLIWTYAAKIKWCKPSVCFA